MGNRNAKIGKVKFPTKPKEKTILPFGKYEGEYIEDVPLEYLQWLVNQPGFRQERKRLSKQIDKVIDEADDSTPFYSRYDYGDIEY